MDNGYARAPARATAADDCEVRCRPPTRADDILGKRKCRQKCPIGRGEPHPLLTELALQHHDLVAQGEYLDSLVSITHRQQAQHGERIRHAQVGQSQQHGRSSCRRECQPREGARSGDCAGRPPVHRAPPPTRPDGFFGRRSVIPLASAPNRPPVQFCAAAVHGPLSSRRRCSPSCAGRPARSWPSARGPPSRRDRGGVPPGCEARS